MRAVTAFLILVALVAFGSTYTFGLSNVNGFFADPITADIVILSVAAVFSLQLVFWLQNAYFFLMENFLPIGKEDG